MKILLVEDNDIVSKMIGMLLAKANCTFDCAVTGNQAMASYFAKPYDMILMDIGLPDINGIMVSKLIRTHQPPFNTYVPIVAITAHCDAHYKKAALNAGIDDFLTKPIDFKALAHVLNKFNHATNTA